MPKTNERVPPARFTQPAVQYNGNKTSCHGENEGVQISSVSSSGRWVVVIERKSNRVAAILDTFSGRVDHLRPQHFATSGSNHAAAFLLDTAVVPLRHPFF